jgi:hypothetical protein
MGIVSSGGSDGNTTGKAAGGGAALVSGGSDGGGSPETSLGSGGRDGGVPQKRRWVRAEETGGVPSNVEWNASRSFFQDIQPRAQGGKGCFRDVTVRPSDLFIQGFDSLQKCRDIAVYLIQKRCDIVAYLLHEFVPFDSGLRQWSIPISHLRL